MRSFMVSLLAIALVACSTEDSKLTQARAFGAGPGFTQGQALPLLSVSSSPDGVLSAQIGTFAIDTTTGVMWQNRKGTTRWDPTYIPRLWGSRVFTDIDDANFVFVNLGAGTNSEATPPSGRIGARLLTVTAAGADGVRGEMGGTGQMTLGSGVAVLRGSAIINTLSDGTNRASLRIGGGDATALGDSTDGVYLEYDLNGNASQDFFLVAASNSTRTRVDTGIAPVAGVYFNYEIRVNAAGTLVTAEINGVASANSVSTNIPTGVGRGFAPGHVIYQKTLGAGALTAAVDWWDAYQVFSAPRGL